MSMKLNWTDDPQAESQLSQIGLAWTRADVRFCDVAIKESLDNNARLDKPLCEETALEYACAMHGGAKFPAPIFRLNGGGKFRVLSGNHRVGGIDILIDNRDLSMEDAVFYRAYVVIVDDPAMVELVCRSANRWQGRRQGKAEALEHAKWMMVHYSMSIEELAKNFFLPVKALRDRFRAEELRNTIHSLNVPTSNLTDNQVVALGRLAFNQKLLSRAAAVAQEYKLRLEDTKTLADRVKSQSQNGEQAGMIAIKEMEESHRNIRLKVPENSVAARRPMRSRFYTHLNSFHNFVRCGNKGRAFDTLEQLQIANKHDRHEAHEVWKSLKKTMDTMFHLSHVCDTKGQGK